MDSTVTWGMWFQVLSLQNRTLELDVLLQSKEELLNKTREELETGIKEGQKNIKTIQEFQQVESITLRRINTSRVAGNDLFV